MSANRNSSIYILIAVLLVVGIFVFVLKQPLLAFLSKQVFGEQDSTIEQILKPSNSAAIELNMLKKQEFKVLKDQVYYFDFNVIGKPVAKPGISGDLPKWQASYKGNFNPFFQKLEEVDETK